MAEFCEIALKLECFLKENQIESLVGVTLHFTELSDRARMECALHREMVNVLMYAAQALSTDDFKQFRMAGIDWKITSKGFSNLNKE